MTKKDTAAADDATVVLPAGEGGRRRFALSRKMVVIAGSATAAVVLAGVATWALWPSAAHAPAVKAAKLKTKDKARAVAAVASDAAADERVDVSAQAAPESAAEPRADAASAAAPRASHPAVAAAAAASAPAPEAAAGAAEDPMDKLRRRLGETLGHTAKLEAGAPGELRLVAARSSAAEPATMPRRSGKAPAPRDTESDAALPRRAAAAAHAQALHWDYDGDGGPSAWGRLKPEFAGCASGRRQSPIDIRDGVKVDLEPVQFDYRASAFRVVDDGHTVQVNVAGGNTITVQGRRYELQQFHFHRPSEEYVNGRQYDMVAHMVHKDADGRLAVVAVLLDRGEAQPVVQAVWNNLPLEKNEELAASQPLDLNRLLPEDRRYYTYMGSLTTPPCSEGVLWLVMKHPMPISPEQVAIFARLYPMNARPLQAASGRLIKESN